MKEFLLKTLYFLEALYYFPRKSVFVAKNFMKYQNRYSRIERIKKITHRIFYSKIPKEDYRK